MTCNDEPRLWAELTGLRMQIEDAKGSKGPAELVRNLETRALQVAIQLKAECERRVQ